MHSTHEKNEILHHFQDKLKTFKTREERQAYLKRLGFKFSETPDNRTIENEKNKDR